MKYSTTRAAARQGFGIEIPGRLYGALHACAALLFIGLSAFLFQGCEQVVDVKLPPHKPQLVIGCTFSPDSIMSVLATSSKPIQAAGEPGPVTNATIIVDQDNVPWDTLDLDFLTGLPIYVSERKPEVGHTYRIRASAPGFDPVQGEDRIPAAVPIGNITRRDSAVGSNIGSAYSELAVTFQDPVGLGDTYVISLYELDSTEIAPGFYAVYYVPVEMESADPAIEMDYSLNEAMFSDATFEGGSATIRVLTYTRTLVSKDVYLALGKVSDNYYRYKTSFASVTNNAFNPFAEPPLVYSNMTGRMGIFAGYSRTQVKVPD